MLFVIGKTIREVRKNCKMTQQGLAEKLGMNRTTIGQIENGAVRNSGRSAGGCWRSGMKG